MLTLTSSPPLLSIDQRVASITLSRPKYRNRLDNEDLLMLKDMFDQVNSDASINVLVLRSLVTPERPVFSAGYNASQFDRALPDVGVEQVMEALERLRPVTICALNGSVYGAATDFPLACDLTIGVEGIEMCMPAAALGLHYYPSGFMRYVSRLGASVAKRAFLTAQPFDAATLLEIGYLHELVPKADFEAHVTALVTRVSSLAPMALQLVKKSINELARGDFDRDRLLAREQATMTSRDFAEGRRAFAEKRAAVWEGC